jgi:crotonobetainyl-CoA:carnitine CoA-transferase CaiB-like acyl-CoA transferase
VAVLPIGATLTTLIRWCAKEGLIPETWTEDEDWTTYDVKLSAGEPVSHALEEVMATINRYFLDKPKNHVLEKCLQEGVSIAPVNTIAELTRFKQLEERGFWLNAILPNGQELPMPGFFARLNNAPMKVRRWSPTLGQHNNEVLGGLLGYSSFQISKACGSAGSHQQHT